MSNVNIEVGVWKEMTFANALHQIGAMGFNQSIAYSVVALTNSKINIRQPVSLRANTPEDAPVSDIDLEVSGRMYSFRTGMNAAGEEETAYIVRRAA